MTKTVLITGSSTGIGRACAEFFSRRGWNVAATMRKPEAETELGKLPNVRCYRLDVLDRDSIEETLKTIMHDFGRLDTVVNNAGYAALGPFEAADEAEVRRQFDTNVFGLMHVTQAVLPIFRAQKDGTIINIASVGGRITFPLYSLYHASKWAVEGFSESLHFELKPLNIKVRIIEPGAIKTDFYDRSQSVLKKDGLHDYDGYVSVVVPHMQKAGADARGPEIVAKMVFKAATDKSFRLRYAVGGGAPLLLFLRRLIPERWFYGIVRSRLEKK